ncbi:MAG: hypothetical protein EBS34_02200 [Flavobacteriales bacterium]|nr:hypothetical protein [Flavobacteriales bacterium]
MKNFISLLFLIVFLSSCYKEKKTIVTVLVKDENGQSLQNAEVRLFAEPTSTSENNLINDYKNFSNAKGEVFFNLTNIYQPGQTGVGVLALEGKLNSLFGTNIVSIEQEKNNIVQLILY